jgi:dihydroorotase
MNPPLRNENARQRLFDRLTDGAVDCVATDHAPHTLEEKDTPVSDAPSGVPGVETLYPLMLALAFDGELELSRVVELVAEEPARIFGFDNKGAIREGNDADLVFVDETFEDVRAERLHSKCEWTPYEGFDGVFPQKILRRGEVVYERDDEGERFAEGGGRLLE